MATVLSQAIADAYLKLRNSPTKGTVGTLYTGTPSELQSGDFIYGARAVVTGAPTVSGTNHIIPVSRLGLTGSLTWPSSQAIYFER